jgi:hypothetical protein
MLYRTRSSLLCHPEIFHALPPRELP